MSVPLQITFDALDPARLAEFWASALGYQLETPPEGYASWPEFLAALGVPREDWNRASAIVDPERSGPRLYFQRVTKRKGVPNRLHLDLSVSGGPETPVDARRRVIAGEVARLRALGASERRVVDREGDYWVVMRDPEGNEFCLQ